MHAIMFAILAALSFGLWTTFHRLAGALVGKVFGAILISLTAVIVGLPFFLLRDRSIPLYTNIKGVWFIIAAGVMAFLIDYFALQAYARNLPLTIGGPLIIGGALAATAVIGFFLGDTITPLKIIGIVLILAGGAILGAVTQ